MSSPPQSLFAERLRAKPWLLADGATGTAFMRSGLEAGYPPDLWNLEHPERVRRNHRLFLEAGVDLALTNTFGANAERLKLHGAEHRVFELNRLGAELLRAEAERDAKARHLPTPAIVAGSVGPTGVLLEPLGALGREAAAALFYEQARGLKAGGADCAWIESFSAPAEAEAALEGAAAAGLPAAATFSFDSGGNTMMGLKPEALSAFVERQAHPPLAYGSNCGAALSDFLDSFRRTAASASPSAILIAKANRGVPVFGADELRWPADEHDMADWAVFARDLGAKIIGGCCGNEADHIRAIRRRLEETPPAAAPPTASCIQARFGEPAFLRNQRENPREARTLRNRRRG